MAFSPFSRKQLQDYLFGLFVVLLFVGITLFFEGRFEIETPQFIVSSSSVPTGSLQVSQEAIELVRPLTEPFPSIALPSEDQFGRINPFSPIVP